ncbi:hypothetical protein OSB04_006527 [Centaurea solstitialis]|uniref:Retrovirus-related Pol polyprotein from transposon TNT 1-94 n=1 Tax=Centaurea solstitialis TaxID=347529 RepID=A0AA38WHJ5_9ASTR|nr:hypothetical protein OSB04_006527 [Centaurea solstitialis]
MTGTLELLSHYVNKEGSSVPFGGNQKGKIKGYGMTVKGEIIVNQVSYVDGLKHNLISVSQLCDNGMDVIYVEAARTMLNASGLPLTLWAEAVSTACYTQNRSLVVKRFEKTPYLLLYNKRPNIKVFHVFGCKCFVLNDREPVGNFDPKGDSAIFLGYAWDTVAYRVYVPRTKLLVLSTNVKVDDSFQVIQDKFSEELKKQADASSNATIVEDLENLFQEWYVLVFCEILVSN